MITLWGRINSINVQKVVWTLDEIGLAYERKDVGGPFGYPAEYAAMNPNALVPTLDEDGFTLWESNVIVRYLAAKYPQAGLYPQDAKIRARADQWMDWQTTNGTSAMREAFHNLVRTAPEKRDPVAIKASAELSHAKAAVLEAALATQPYIAGEAFTMGDIPIACHLHRYLALPIERPDLPRIRAYYDRVRTRPGAKTVCALPLS